MISYFKRDNFSVRKYLISITIGITMFLLGNLIDKVLNIYLFWKYSNLRMMFLSPTTFFKYIGFIVFAIGCLYLNSRKHNYKLGFYIITGVIIIIGFKNAAGVIGKYEVFYKNQIVTNRVYSKKSEIYSYEDIQEINAYIHRGYKGKKTYHYDLIMNDGKRINVIKDLKNSRYIILIEEKINKNIPYTINEEDFNYMDIHGILPYQILNNFYIVESTNK